MYTIVYTANNYFAFVYYSCFYFNFITRHPQRTLAIIIIVSFKLDIIYIYNEVF